MLAVETHDDVQRLNFSTWRSRRAGFSVSTFAVRGVLIDCAFDGVGAELMAWIAANPVAGVIITHAHDDHGGNAERVARAGIPVQMESDTDALLRAPRRRGWHRKWTWGRMPLLTSPVTAFKASGLELLPARGHSPDHYVVWDADRETLFAADLFLGVKVKVAHPVEREDVRQQIDSVRRVAALKPKRVFDAHRGLLEDGATLLKAKASWMEETVGRIDTRIAEGWPDASIVRDVFGRESFFAYTSFGDLSCANFVTSVRSTYSR
ncbi:MAG: MBL fold metallo-hydrolase [Gemmatimonadetes bacterium]|nr:MBL fold metallo-hydrolase [Gemmatimonadota bacterium]